MEKLRLIRSWKTLLLLVCMSMFSATIFAQGITLRGKVVDQKGEPLIGAKVAVTSSAATAVATNISGDFTLRVPAGTNKITISYIGYVSLDVTVTPGKTDLGQIPLAQDQANLSEVVVVGYGNLAKRDITGATQQVDSKSLLEVPSNNISSELQGKVAGLDVISTSGSLGATPTIHIRGNKTIGAAVNSAADQPLLVVDGVPYTGSIADINPSDIKNIEVLKDASSTAIYGSRGSSGVLLITTNRGREGRSITTLNIYEGVKNVVDDLHVLSAAQYVQLKDDAVTGSVLQGFGATQAYTLAPLEKAGIANGTNTDWQKALYQTGMVSDQNIGISGGTETTTFNVGAGYRVETGVEPNQRYERYSLQTVLDHKISKTIRVGINVTNTLTYNNQPGGFQGLNAAQTTPLAPIFNADGTFDAFPYAGQTDSSYPSALYPKYNSSAFYNNSRAFHNFTSLYGEWSILKDLKYKLSFGYDFTQNYSGAYNGVNSTNSIVNQSQTTATTGNNDGYHYTLDNLLTYDKVFGKHRIQFTGLFSTEKNHYQNTSITGTNIPQDANLNTNLGLAQSLTASGSYAEYGLISEMARIVYSYDARFALTGTVRQDANSELAVGHQYLAYPAVGAAWTITNEKWMQQYDWINNLKLRAGYGITSNGALGGTPYQTLAPLSTSNNSGISLKYEYGGQAAGNAIGYLAGQLPNPNLSWQKTGSFNLGLDFAVLKNRITGSVDVYSEKTTGIILSNQLPGTIGSTSQTSNLGSSADKGLEIGLSSINIQNAGGFSWTTDFNIAFSREHIVSLPNGLQAATANGEFVGWPLNVIWDNKKIGIWQLSDATQTTQTLVNPNTGQSQSYLVSTPVTAQSSPKQYPGQIRVLDVNGDGVINQNDNVIVGTFQPQYTGGITNRFAYKDFDLSIVIQARMGVTALAPYLGSGGSSGGWAYLGTGRHTQPVVNYWTPSNPTGTFPEPNDNNQSYLYGSTTTYVNGSWVKARSINLGYNVPAKLLTKAGISSLRLYVNCTNPFIIYNPSKNLLDGLDPETNAIGQGIAGQNGGNAAAGRAASIWYGSDPTQRMFIFGANLRF